MLQQNQSPKTLLSYTGLDSPPSAARTLKKIPTLSTHIRNFSTQQGTPSKTPSSISKRNTDRDRDRKPTIPHVHLNNITSSDSIPSLHPRKSSYVSTNTMTQLAQNSARPKLEHLGTLSPRAGMSPRMTRVPTLIDRDHLKEIVMTQQHSPRSPGEKYHAMTPRHLTFSNKYSALTTEPGQDYVKETPSYHAMKSLDKFCQMDDIITFMFEGMRRTVSIRTAKRVMTVLRKNLKSLSHPRSRDNLSSPVHLDAIAQSNEQYILFERMNSIVNELLLYCDRASVARRSHKSLDYVLKEMCEVAQRSENSELSLYCLYIHAKSHLARSDFVEAVHNFKLFKELCTAHNSIKSKLKAYRSLGKCFQELQKYKVSLNYFTKFLQVAWYLNSGKHELLAYDFIGLQYYYLGELEKASHYHSRMAGGHLEPDSSNLKQIGIAKVKAGMEKEFISLRTDRNKRRDTPINIGKRPKEGQDDMAEVSSIDEDFELPIQATGQHEAHLEKKLDDVKENKDLPDIAKLSPKRKIQRIVVGQMKAKVAQIAKEKSKDRLRTINGEGRKNLDTLKPSIDLKVLTKLPANLKAKLNEPIFMSHLSRNRQLKNFTSSMPQYLMEEEIFDPNDALDVKSMEKIKRILEKFKINLLVIQKTMQSLQGQF